MKRVQVQKKAEAEVKETPKLKGRKVRCSQCKKLKFVNAKALASRLDKFGSIEKIEELWLCRACSRKEKEALNK